LAHAILLDSEGTHVLFLSFICLLDVPICPHPNTVLGVDIIDANSLIFVQLGMIRTL